MKVLVVDDLQENIDLVTLYVKQYCPGITKVYSAKNVEESIEKYKKNLPELLFLDVELDEDHNIFEFLDFVDYSKSVIVFITAHEKYAIKLINKINIAGYITKPINVIDFVKVVRKAKDNLTVLVENNNAELYSVPKNYIAVSSSDKIEILLYDDIVYIEADGRYSIFHLKNSKTIVSSKNIGEYEKKIDESKFLRIHHKFIINIKHVVKINRNIGYECELILGVNLPISNRKVDNLKSFLDV